MTDRKKVFFRLGLFELELGKIISLCGGYIILYYEEKWILLSFENSSPTPLVSHETLAKAIEAYIAHRLLYKTQGKIL